MVFNFKKVAAGFASIAMIGLTAGTAYAASFPAPFVNNGSSDVAIVWGSSASSSDLTAATEIQSALSSAVASQGGGSAPTGGDFVQVQKSTDRFNLGNSGSTFFSSGIDSDDLSTILADGVFRNEDNDDFEYEQDIDLGSWTLSHISDNDFNNDEPALGIELLDGAHVMNYTVDFTPDAAEGGTGWNDFEGNTIEMLGKEYYILSADNSTGTLELLDSANSVTLSEGEVETVQAGGSTYETSISFIGSTEVRLNINGEVTTTLNEDDTYQLDSGDYVGIKDILVQDYAGGTKQVEFSIGSGKIELIDGEEVEINNEDISDNYDHVITAFMSEGVSGGESTLDDFTLKWNVDEDFWLGFDTGSNELEMPGFGAIKLSVADFVTPAQEVTSVEHNSDTSFTLDTTVTDGDVSFDFLYGVQSTASFTGIGKSSTEQLVTNGSDATGSNSVSIMWNESTDEYFVATWWNGDDHESYVLEVSDIDDSTPSENATTIRSIASGSNQQISIDIDETDEIGEISFFLEVANEDDGTATINISAAGGAGTISAAKLITAEGMMIQLPFDSVDTSLDGAINLSNSSQVSTFAMNFTEEDKDGDIKSGDHFNMTLGWNSANETTVSSVDKTEYNGGTNYETTDGSDDFVGYVQSDLATRVLHKTGDDQDDVEITYHGQEAYGEVFVSELDASTSGGALGNVIFTDDEVSSFDSDNLIVVGGSAVNNVAAALLGLPEGVGGDRWEDATDVGAGSFLIQTFESPFSSSKVATLVAGYNAGDTTNAATYLTTQDDVTTDEGSKYVGTSGTSATLVTS